MSNKRMGSKSAPYMRTDNTGLFHSPGPYIAIVKNNIDPSRAGRLQVYIPQFGGSDENNPSNWLTVSYASPFAGQTRQRIDVNSYVDTNIDVTNQYENSFQSYGFWFVPPDLNGRVLVIFANGDPSQGYYFACIRDSMDSHMTPGIGAVKASKSATDGGYIWRPTGANAIATHTMLQSYIELTQNGKSEIPFRLPVSEPVLIAQANSSPSTPLQVQMVPQVYQTKQLGMQGLAFDFIRGSTSASSVRENPSQVFGISTPGRLISFANVATSASVISQIQEFLNSNQVEIVSNNQENQDSLTKSLTCTYRTGGHSFVMDDGTIDGFDQGIRIRTTSGNEILMDDTNGQIYIINSQGTAWVELSPSGYIDIFSANNFSIRSQGDINFHADKNINMNAIGKIKIHSGDTTQIDSIGSLTTRSSSDFTLYSTDSIQLGTSGTVAIDSKGAGSIQSGDVLNIKGTKINLNSGSGKNVKDPGILQQSKQIDVIQSDGSKVWWSNGKFDSICSRAPAHEPWPNHEINGIKTTAAQGNDSGQSIVRPQTGTTSSGVRGTTTGKTINESQIASQPVVGVLCGLTVRQTQALLAQIGQNENSGNYSGQNSLGFAGKYQLGADALIDCGLMKQGSHSSGTNLTAINNPANWTGNPCSSVSDFLNNPSIQEQAIMLYTKKHCISLQKAKVITSASTPEEIGGYLMAAHLVGVGGAIKLFQIQNNLQSSSSALTKDANGTTSNYYFAQGSNAVALGSSSEKA